MPPVHVVTAPPLVPQQGLPEDAVHDIGVDLRGLAVPLISLNPSPDNARRHDLSRDVTVIAASLRRFGQRKPIVAKAEYMGVGRAVIAGNGTLLAAQSLGWSHIAVSWFSGTDEEAQAYALVDNRSAELSQWDLPTLAAQLQAIHARDGAAGVEGLGWAAHESGPLMQANWTPPAEGRLHPDQATREGSWRSMRFSVAQWAVVELAIQRIQAREHDPAMPEGRAIELIAADYLSGADAEATA